MRRSPRSITPAASLVAAFGLCTLTPVLSHAQGVSGPNTSIARYSVSTSGAEGNDGSAVPSVSGDGRYIAFFSDATNLVADKTNTVRDIYVRDRFLNLTERASLANTGGEGNDDSSFPSISADGRFVVFESHATNLVANDQNHARDIFVRDRLLGTTERVSVATDGTEANGASAFPRISVDGRFVVFQSAASNLVAGDTNQKTDIFVRDRLLSLTTRASVSSLGDEADADCARGSITTDGNLVVFESAAGNLSANDQNQSSDIFVHNFATGQTTRVSVSSGGIEGDGSSFEAQISPPGKYVIFSSAATNLVDGGPAAFVSIYLRNLDDGSTKQMNRAWDGSQVNSDCFHPGMSYDGRFITFSSFATNLVDDDTNGREDVFIYDRTFDHTSRVSVAADGTQMNGFSSYPGLAGDGSFVSFMSDASNLITTKYPTIVHIYGFDVAFGPPPPAKPFVTMALAVKRAREMNNKHDHADVVSVSGSYEFNQLSVDGKLSPPADPVIVRVGQKEAPAMFSIPAKDSHWKNNKKGVWTWRSAPGSKTIIYLKIDTAKHTFEFRASGFDWPAFDASKFYLRLQIGNDTGIVEKGAVKSKFGKSLAI
ncbi:MAG: PD40 domain-containing protein [Planctomycetes bacterium]|nr:PD40 domain-containing protein [Planctomycetota bacterium]